jgi:hypothetical protein
MNAKEREILIDAIFDNMRAHVQNKNLFMPDNWDGHAIREYIADQFDWERSGLLRDKRGKLYRDYKNAINTTPL